jgi:hypothetical protein
MDGCQGGSNVNHRSKPTDKGEPRKEQRAWSFSGMREKETKHHPAPQRKCTAHTRRCIRPGGGGVMDASRDNGRGQGDTPHRDGIQVAVEGLDARVHALAAQGSVEASPTNGRGHRAAQLPMPSTTTRTKKTIEQAALKPTQLRILEDE